MELEADESCHCRILSSSTIAGPTGSSAQMRAKSGGGGGRATPGAEPSRVEAAPRAEADATVANGRTESAIAGTRP